MPFRLDRMAKRAARAVTEVTGEASSSVQHMLGVGGKKKHHHHHHEEKHEELAEAAKSLLEDFVKEGKTIRLRSLETKRFVRIHQDGRIDCSGGNGQLPYLYLSGEDRYHARLVSIKFDPQGLSFKSDGTRPISVDGGTDIIIDVNDDGTICLVEPTGKYCLSSHAHGGLFPVLRAVNKSTCFALMVDNEEIKLADDDSVLPDEFVSGLDPEELDEEFAPIMAMDEAERSELVGGMDAFARYRLHEYKANELRKARERKENRHYKRVEMSREVDEDKFAADIQGLEARIEAVLAAPVEGDEEEQLALDESDDEIDQDEFDAFIEAKARIEGEELARAEEEAAEAERIAQEKRQQAEEARVRMEEERIRIEEEAQAALAAAAAAEDEAEPEEVQHDEDDETNDLNEISESDGATESRLDIPDPEPAITDKPDFDSEAAAKAIYKATKGFGCDDNAVRETILSISNAQRQELHRSFKTMYGKDMNKVLQKKVGGKLGKLIVAAMMPPAVYDAERLHYAMSGIGTSDSILIEVICTRTAEELATVKETYKATYGKELEDRINSETSGSYRRLLVSLLVGGRNTNQEVDHELAKSEAELLKKNVCGWSRDESVLNQILALRSSAQIRATLAEYKALTGFDINTRLRKFLSSKLASGYIAIIACARNPSRYFAEHIYKAFRGFGMDEDTVIRIMVSRSEIDLKTIKELYPDIAGETLHKAIKSECTSHFRRACNNICNI